jgi:hypothetical protein
MFTTPPRTTKPVKPDAPRKPPRKGSTRARGMQERAYSRLKTKKAAKQAKLVPPEAIPRIGNLLNKVGTSFFRDGHYKGKTKLTEADVDELFNDAIKESKKRVQPQQGARPPKRVKLTPRERQRKCEREAAQRRKEEAAKETKEAEDKPLKLQVECDNPACCSRLKPHDLDAHQHNLAENGYGYACCDTCKDTVLSSSESSESSESSDSSDSDSSDDEESDHPSDDDDDDLKLYECNI